MKRIPLLILVALLAMPDPVPAQTATFLDSTYAVPYYKQRLEFFRQMPDRKKEIVFLGDSHIELGEWQEIIPRHRVINRGINGDNSYGILMEYSTGWTKWYRRALPRSF